ncbi:MAG: hypothetical protein H6741_27940 [Alphaproteobacteria bacterium]|nr:hypothetical protein [Alphaproteobacteria bacterium]MCB9796547.1 hypothetical protein [Alphaproteobacteria bacterium]
MRSLRQKARPPTYAGLTTSLFALVVLPALLAPVHQAALAVVPAITLIFLARLARGRGSVLVWSIRGLLLWTVLRFALAGIDLPALERAGQALGLLSMLGLTGALLGKVVEDGPVDVERLHAAASTYLLAGFAFATVYQTMESVQPGSLSGLPETRALRNQALTYFSFMTLTTVGYGDMAPKSPLAWSLVTLQAAAGQLYLAVLVGRLIGLHLGGPRDAPPSGDPDPRDAD